jgi:hypothetical protein
VPNAGDLGRRRRYTRGDCWTFGNMAEWATDVRGFAIDSGHYLAEEAPDATAKALIEFFTAA